MKDKHLTIMWAWTSGLNFLECIYNGLAENWLMVAFFWNLQYFSNGTCSFYGEGMNWDIFIALWLSLGTLFVVVLLLFFFIWLFRRIK